ncbi:MAG: hypothetical protein ACYC3S_05495 [Chloroflexota bacterium]
MAKKTGGRAQSKAQRRVIHRAETAVDSAVVPPPTAPAQAVTPSAAPVPPAPPARYAARGSASAIRRSSQHVAPITIDYTYVRNDLTRVGILVAIVVVALLGLTIVLR